MSSRIVYIDGAIEPPNEEGGIGTFNQFKQDVERQGDYDTLIVRINTFGGHTSEAKHVRMLMDELKGKGIHIITHALSHCDSAGILIFGGGDERWIDRFNESFLIHQVRMRPVNEYVTKTEAKELYAELSESDNELASIYVHDYGLDHEQAMEIINEEKPLKPAKLLELGIVTKIVDSFVNKSTYRNIHLCKSLDLSHRYNFTNETQNTPSLQESNFKENMVYEKYISQNLGYRRSEMPQIPLEHEKEFISYFKASLGTGNVVKTKIPNTSIKPTQADFSTDKIQEKQKDKDYLKRNFFISQDFYLVDGHHSWAASLEDSEGHSLNVIIIQLPIEKLIKKANKLKITNTMNTIPGKFDFNRINRTGLNTVDTGRFILKRLSNPGLTKASFKAQMAVNMLAEFLSNGGEFAKNNMMVETTEGQSFFIFTEGDDVEGSTIVMVEEGEPTDQPVPSGSYDLDSGSTITVEDGMITAVEATGEETETNKTYKEEEENMSGKNKYIDQNTLIETITNAVSAGVSQAISLTSSDQNKMKEEENKNEDGLPPATNQTGQAQAAMNVNEMTQEDQIKFLIKSQQELARQNAILTETLENVKTSGVVMRGGQGSGSLPQRIALNSVFNTESQPNDMINNPIKTERGRTIIDRIKRIAGIRNEDKYHRGFPNGQKYNANSVAFTGNDYTMEAILDMMSISVLGGDTVQKGMWRVMDGIKKGVKVTVSEESVSFQNPSSTFTPDSSDSSITYAPEWNPVVIEIHKAREWDDLRESYHTEWVDRGSNNDYNAPAQIAQWWVSRILEKVAIGNDALFWGGKTNTPAEPGTTDITYSFSANYLGIIGKVLDPTLGALTKRTAQSSGQLSVSAITQANPAVITVTSTANLYVGDYVTISGVDAGTMGTLLNGKDWEIQEILTATTFSIKADTSSVSAFADAGGNCVVRFINRTNIIENLSVMYNMMDAETRESEDFFLAIPPHLRPAYEIAVSTVATGAGTYFKDKKDLVFLGNKMQIANYMPKNSIFSNKAQNNVIGTDLLVDSSTIRMIANEAIYTQNERATARMRFAHDVNWIFPQKVSLISSRYNVPA